MNTSKNEQLMNDLRLHGMLASWQALLETRRHNELSLVEGLQLLLQAEWLERGRRRVQRLTKAAGFRYQASLDELSYLPSRGLDKNTIALMADGQYIQQGQAVLIPARPEAGKVFWLRLSATRDVGSATGSATLTCRNSFSSWYWPALMEQS